MRNKLNTINFFQSKNVNINERIRDDFIDGDLAVISVKVDSYEDVISHYSVKGYETPNSELLAYIEDCAKVIPAQYPLVLEITGHTFSDEQQHIIRTAFEDYYAYGLAEAQRHRKKGIIVFFIMLIAMFFTAYICNRLLPDGLMWADLVYIGFWTCADFVLSFILGGGVENRNSKIMAARLNSIQIQFQKEFSDESYTALETQKIVEDMINNKI